MKSAAAFWGAVTAGPPDQCWEWSRARSARGYGNVWWEGTCTSAHRVAWALTNGPIPDGLVVRHTCDNPPCCNPAHLLLGTQAENIRDRHERGRHWIRPQRGEANGSAKVTARQVLEMRRLYRLGMSARELGEMFGISLTAAWSAVTGRTWGHLDGATEAEIPVQAKKSPGAGATAQGTAPKGTPMPAQRNARRHTERAHG